MTASPKKKTINGVLLFNKPLHLSSNQALQKVKWLFNAAKAGHTGTLDPLATGMLPICFGEATKYSQFLLNADKTYQVTAKLGITTESGDAEGNIITTKSVPIFDKNYLQSIIAKFVGTISQTPPMHSAIKHQGKPLYELARRGITVERKPRIVQIYSITLDKFSADELSLTVHCSKGTYIRTLIMDMGDAIGCGAHVSKLHRLSLGHFTHYPMISLEMLEATKGDAQTLLQYLLPTNSLLHDMAEFEITAEMAIALCQGKKLLLQDTFPDNTVSLITTEKQFVGVGKITANILSPFRMMHYAIDKGLPFYEKHH